MVPATTARRLPVLVTLALVVVVLGLGPVTTLAAALAPVAPVAVTRPPGVPHLPTPGPTTPGASVRELPAGLTIGEREHPATGLADLTRAAVGAPASKDLLARLRRGSEAPYDATRGDRDPYPSRLPWVERLLDQAPGRARTAAASRLAAQLIALSAARSADDASVSRHPDAAPLAYALLVRSRAAGGCDAETNLLLLLAADDKPHDDLVTAQARAADRACPGDPTPLWLLGQFQSQRAVLAGLHGLSDAESQLLPDDRFARAARTAELLVARFPGSPDAWLGYGDAQLRAATELGPTQPFTSRADDTRALAAYEDAGRLGAASAARLGQAGALLGLGRPAPALALVPGGEDAERPGPALDLRLRAQEAAHDFAGAFETADHLVQLGTAAFPQAGAAYPRQQPLTSGAGRWVPLTVRLKAGPTSGSGGGADAVDQGFLPVFRNVDQVTGDLSACPRLARARAAILEGDPAQARDAGPAAAEGPTGRWCDAADLRGIAAVELGTSVSPDGPSSDRAQDERQDLWRWAGQLDHAAAAATAWDEATGRSQLVPALRVAEVRSLQGGCTDAAALFGVADRRGESGYAITPAQGRTRLDRAAALLACGRADEGTRLLREVDRDATAAELDYRTGVFHTPDEGVAHSYDLLSYYARLQLADAERVSGAADAAAEDYAAAAERLPRILGHQANGVFVEDDVLVVPGVADNGWALAELARNRPAAAEEHARAAVAADPESSVFLLTLEVAQRQAGHAGPADDTATRLVGLDPTAYPGWNDHAVALAATHHDREAVAALRRAVGARPDYALGWFNLGVLESRRGPVSALLSQGAFGRAFAVDPALEQAPRTLTADDHTYATGLDLSRPLPSAWSWVAVEQRRPTAGLGVLGLVVAVLAAMRGVGGPAGSLVNQAGPLADRLIQRVGVLRGRRHVGWAVGATLVAFALTALRGPYDGIFSLFLFLGGVACLVGSVLAGRLVFAGRHGARIVQRSWVPGLLIGVVSGAFGAPWAPLPYVRGPARAAAIHLVAPLLMVVVGAGLLVESHVTPAPVVRALAIAALTMAVSLLVPVRPLDGARLQGGAAAVGVAAVLFAGLVTLGLA
jgi:hypothetical protein